MSLRTPDLTQTPRNFCASFYRHPVLNHYPNAVHMLLQDLQSNMYLLSVEA